LCDSFLNLPHLPVHGFDLLLQHGQLIVPGWAPDWVLWDGDGPGAKSSIDAHSTALAHASALPHAAADPSAAAHSATAATSHAAAHTTAFTLAHASTHTGSSICHRELAQSCRLAARQVWRTGHPEMAGHIGLRWPSALLALGLEFLDSLADAIQRVFKVFRLTLQGIQLLLCCRCRAKRWGVGRWVHRRHTICGCAKPRALPTR